jgi:hypothetical protein
MEPNELTCQEVVALVTEYLEHILLLEMQTKVDKPPGGVSRLHDLL